MARDGLIRPDGTPADILAGLVSFRRNFCEAWVESDPRDIEPQGPNEPAADPPEETPMRPIDQGLMQVPETKFRDAGCGWGAFQSRSYFAIRLNDNWWLWGLDSQLDAPIASAPAGPGHRPRTRRRRP